MLAFKFSFTIYHTQIARIMWTRLHSIGLILDVACGEGYTYSVPLQLINRFPLSVFIEKMEAVALDLKNYKSYRKRGRKIGKLENFVQADAHKLPFKDKAFDTVTLTEILEHPVDPVQLLREAKRVAKNRILVTVPDEIEWIRRRVFRHFSIFDSVEHVRLFTKDKLANYFMEAGLTSFKIDHILFGENEFYTAIIDGGNS